MAKPHQYSRKPTLGPGTQADVNTHRELPLSTGFFGLIGSLFRGVWDQQDMEGILETDDNFEIVASTIKSIYDQTCRSCGLINRMIIFRPGKDGKVVRKLRTDHRLGDTKAKQRYLRPNKCQSEAAEPLAERGRKMNPADHDASGRTQAGGTKIPPQALGARAGTTRYGQDKGPRANSVFERKSDTRPTSAPFLKHTVLSKHCFSTSSGSWLQQTANTLIAQFRIPSSKCLQALRFRLTQARQQVLRAVSTSCCMEVSRTCSLPKS